MKTLFSTFLISIFTFSLTAQTQTVTGVVKDAQTKEGLPFASISIKNTLLGTMTDENGNFTLKLDESHEALQISYIGYVDKTIDLNEAESELSIMMTPYEYELAEVTVRPKSALYYIQEAIKQYPNTISNEGFKASAFFMERTSLANDMSNAYQMDKAVFDIYFPNYSNKEIENQNQLVLYEFKEEGESKSILMENKRIRNFEARQKKKNEKRARKGEPIEEEEAPTVNINLSDVGAGGPSMSLGLAQSFIEDPFFDEDYFKKFSYTFGEDTYYNGRQLMAINFSNKRKIEHAFYKGTVYLDIEDLSIVALDYSARLKVPFYINALIRTVAAFKLNTVTSNVSIKNQKHGDLWYPKEIIGDIKLQIEQEKRIEDIAIKQILNIFQVNIEDAAEIEEAFRFDPDKEMEEQTHNPDGLKWSDINMTY